MDYPHRYRAFSIDHDDYFGFPQLCILNMFPLTPTNQTYPQDKVTFHVVLNHCCNLIDLKSSKQEIKVLALNLDTSFTLNPGMNISAIAAAGAFDDCIAPDTVKGFAEVHNTRLLDQIRDEVQYFILERLMEMDVPESLEVMVFLDVFSTRVELPKLRILPCKYEDAAPLFPAPAACTFS